ncbi:nickel-responsive transcriptional regulator NikR [Mycobacterium tuberculosis]|nr:nickel-responsive transcriptional regulator NikR [Mycobacterium tuberculosis]MBP0649615.1 nickel-responsive transcriptional regulator NikR [Mycobacterium tuberculosis]
MQRVTMTFDDDLVAEIDAFMLARGYSNRSEAMRDLTRAGLADMRAGDAAGGACVGALVYVFDHERRELARRLTSVHHHHHGLSLATTHVHLDDDTCLEVALLKGNVNEVRHLADHVIAERGVRHGRLVIVPTEPSEDADPHHGHDHSHL